MTTTAPRDAGGRRRGGPPLWFTIVAIGSLVVAVLLLVLQGLGIGVGVRVATPSIAPTGQAAEVTSALVVKALQDAAFQVQDPKVGYRPGESPDLVDVPRAPGPGDPAGGAAGRVRRDLRAAERQRGGPRGPRAAGRISAAGPARSSTPGTRSS